MVDSSLWEKKAQQLLQPLEYHFRTSLKLYFNHLDQADKFYMRREGWIKKLIELKEILIHGNIYVIKGKEPDQLMIKQPATWCHHLVLQLQHPKVTNTKYIEDTSRKEKEESIQKQNPQFLKIPHQMKTLILTTNQNSLKNHLERDLNKNHSTAASKKCVIL